MTIQDRDLRSGRYTTEHVDRLPFNTPEKTDRYRTERYQGATGLNWYTCDPTIQFLMRYYLTPDEYSWCEPHLGEIGALIGGPVSERADQTDKNPPWLERLHAFGDGANVVGSSSAAPAENVREPAGREVAQQAPSPLQKHLALSAFFWLFAGLMAAAAVVFAVFYVITVPLSMIGMAMAGLTEGAEEYAAVPGYLTAEDWFSRLAGLPLAPLFIAFAYPLLLLVVIGYRAGRAGLLDDPAAHRGFLTRVAVVGVSVSVLSALPITLAVQGVLSPGTITEGLYMALQVLSGVLGGAGYAALFALWGVRLEQTPGPLTRAVAAMGQRSLTFYILNSVLVAGVLHPDLVGLGTVTGGAGALLVAALAWSVSLTLAAWLAVRNRPGPLDQLMRRCVYGGRKARRAIADAERREAEKS